MSVIVLVLKAGLRDLSRNRWIVAYAAAFFLLAEALFWFGGTGPQVVLSMLNVVLMVAPLVALVFGTIHVYASREFVELLLAQPVPRAQLFAGLYLGLALPLAGAFAVGAGIPFALHLSGGASAGALAALFAAGIGLSVAFAAIASWIALSTDDRLKGVGIALGTWMVTTIAYDGLVLAATAVFGDYPLEKPMLAMMILNPVDIARVLVLTRLDVSALMGYTGALFQHTFGTPVGTVVALAALVAWCVVPLAMAVRRFRIRDF